MKIKYLGTAAAEGIPAMFCDCEICRKSRRLGGKNIRTRSQALIDDKLLIDFPADTYLHCLYQGLDLRNVNHCLVTHTHSDHLYAADFENRREGFAHAVKDIFHVYGTKRIAAVMEGEAGVYEPAESSRVQFHPITLFQSFHIEDYCVTPLEADHDLLSGPMIYLIEKNGQTILYAHDTGIFPERTWEYLKEVKPKLSIVSFDCTAGGKDCKNTHMGFTAVKNVKQRLADIGCIYPETICVLNHFSHNGQMTYEDMKAEAEEQGYRVSYDGMEIEVL